MQQLPIKEFKYGQITSVEPQSIPRGASAGSLNWITNGVKVELRRGMAVLGTQNSGTGRITGLGVAKKPDGTDILFRSRKRKVEYYDTVTSDWIENGTDVLPAAVTATDSLGEDISFEGYQNATGAQMWLNSRNAGPHKIMTANPGSITSMYVLGVNYKGRMRIKGGRMYVWDRFGNPPNKIDVFASRLDVKASSDYTQISAEVVGSGDDNTLTFTGTLAFKAAGARRICFEVTFTDSTETFTDNGDGTLTGSAGGTGTINYTTGAFSITFIVAPVTGVNNITTTYRWADDSATTSDGRGIADFSFSSTRTATEGFILKQAGGGDMKNLASLDGKEYCLHERKTWAVSISDDDLDLTNLVFRDKVGIPNQRAMIETGDGIYYVDDSDKNDQHLRLLRLEYQSSEVVPQSISKQFKIADIKVGVDLTGYLFDKAAVAEFGDLVVFACRTVDSDTNNRVIVYNKITRAIDVTDYYASCLAVYDGTLVAGDSVSDNVYTLFSGYDDLEATIANYWMSSLDNLGYEGMKRVCELTIEGEIGPEQRGKIMMSVDRGPFVEVRSPDDLDNNKHAIEGDGDYVDRTNRVSVGPLTLGRGEVGGGGDGISAYHYRRSFRIALDKFEYIQFKIEALELGYLSLSEFTFRDVRLKSRKTPRRYRANR